MGKIRQIFAFLGVFVCTVTSGSLGDGELLILKILLCNKLNESHLDSNQRSIASSPNGHAYKYLTTVRKQWKCIENICEESVTKCNNGICETTKTHFKSENYQPEVPKIEKPPAEVLNLSEILKLPEFPLIDVNLPFDNSGLIYFVTNQNNFAYYWSNSKHINKKCHGNICTITIKTCMNGKCTEKISTEAI